MLRGFQEKDNMEQGEQFPEKGVSYAKNSVRTRLLFGLDCEIKGDIKNTSPKKKKISFNSRCGTDHSQSSIRWH